MRENELRTHLLAGHVIPAHPLALTAARTLDERRQRALTRYYLDAGAGGIAVGVHTTQFAIRDCGLLAPVLELAARTTADWQRTTAQPRAVALIAGAIGPTPQAIREATIAKDLGYHAVRLSLGAVRSATDAELVDHCRAVADVLPLVGFYLQPAVGGRDLSYDVWRSLCEITRVVAIKVAPFDRYRTLEVMRAVADSGRRDIAMYTGNDDSIVADLVAGFPGGLWFAGGLLGQWAVWTHRAVEMLKETQHARTAGQVPASLLSSGANLTDANAALFDPSHQFAGCIPGIHEALRRQGLLANILTLDEREVLSHGQLGEIDRVMASYPGLRDDEFVAENLDRWLA